MLRRPPRSTRTDTLFPYTTLFRSARKLALFVGFARLADADRLIIGLGVDIDETPVDLAPRRALFERSEEHTSELQSLMRISYAVFCLKKKTKKMTKIIISKERIEDHC